MCKAAISKLDDEQIVFMEQAEVANKETTELAKEAAALLKDVAVAKAALADKEVRLKKELAELQSDYDRVASAVEEGVRDKYIRLRKQRGATTVVGVDRGICGGCHMKLPMQVVLSCQAQQEIVTCIYKLRSNSLLHPGNGPRRRLIRAPKNRQKSPSPVRQIPLSIA